MLYKGILCLLGLAHSVHANWKLDDSCKGDLEDKMNELVSSAFAMAESGLTAVNNAQNGQPQDDDKAKSDNINNIVNWMLIPTGEQPKNLYLKDARRTFQGLVDQNTRDDDQEYSKDTIIIYCDYSRVKGRPEENPTEWVDKDSGLVYNNEKEAFKSCHEIKPVDPTVAYVEVVGDNGISQVQMCPYFMSWLKEKEFTSFKDTAPSSVQTKKLLMKAVTKVLKSRGLDFLTEIDVLSLFDKVILHELTHTRPGQQTNDVDMGEGLGKIKYGWKRCKKLRDETEGTLGDRSPQKNADSLALLGSAVRFVKERDMIVNEDGKVTQR